MVFKDSKDKINIIRIVQRVVQLAAFLLFPAFFATVFASLHSIFTALVFGGFDAAALSRQLILVIGVLVVTALMGRFFCSFLCSFGAMQDLLWFIRTKIKIPQLKVSEKLDKYLKLVKYVVLIGIIALIWTKVAPIDYLWDPWAIFGMYFSIRGWPTAMYLLSIGGALLLLIIIASLVIERSFCRYFCPLGAVLAVVSRFRIFRLKKRNGHCEQCFLCTAGCGMGIQLHSIDTVKSSECIDCFHCVQSCPRDNMVANPKPAVATLMTVGVLTGVYYAGSLAQNAYMDSLRNQAITQPQTPGTQNPGTQNPGIQNPGTQNPGTQNPGEGQNNNSAQHTESIRDLPDGLYGGRAMGFRGFVFVTVTISNGAITDIVVDSAYDDPEFFELAVMIIVPSIISKQSIYVDSVAGATSSGEAIKIAVADALGLDY